MAFVRGGVEHIAVQDSGGTTVVESSNVRDDLEWSEEREGPGLADGQTANAATANSLTFAFLDLSDSDRSQLETWSDNDTKVTASVQGKEFTVHWADPTYIEVNNRYRENGDLHDIVVNLELTR